MSLKLTWQEGVDLLLRNRYSLTLIGAFVYLPTALVVAFVYPERFWGGFELVPAIVATAVGLVGAAIAYAAAIAAIAVEPEGDHEEPTTPLAALRDAVVRVGPLLVLALALTLAAVLAVAVVGLVLLAWWLVSFQVAVVERRGWRESLTRSRALVRDNFWQVLLVLVALSAVTAAIDYALWRVGVEVLPDRLGAWFGGAIADTVNTGLFAAFVTAAYWQLNERSTLREAP